MGLKDAFNRARKLAGKHSDKVDRGLDRGAEYAKRRTGGKYDEHIDKASERASDYVRDRSSGRDPER
ncbi:antitoxin [Thermobifida halotolerans]|uniref:Antitoxin n=2 Tax=Thermobifida halotolerans TaxID=483545 RepID=A0A399G0W5_9ACTN|nr:antitoxin [Thermobifida halotolerans]UOE17912.1 antitoxin [Thermobifida halotolerans]